MFQLRRRSTSRASGKRSSFFSLRLEPLESRMLLDAGLSAQLAQLLLVMKSGDLRTVRTEPAAVDSTLSAWRQDPTVQTAEVDQRVSIATIPNDPQFASMWDMQNTGQAGGTADADIDADLAWNQTTGSLRTAVGVIDTGIDYTHPDLYENVWLNQGEVPTNLGLVDTDADGLITFWDLNAPANAGKLSDMNGNGRIDGYDALHDPRWANGQDNDHNGKVDDLIGWNFVNNTNDPFDDNSHGTHVAGTIGAMGNNGVGVAGVNWKVELAALKFMDSSGSGYTSAAVDALNYATRMGIKITNNSWGGAGYSSALDSAINSARAAGDLFIAAAGNESTNNDQRPSYPANFTEDNILSVAATDRYDHLASYSNYGAATVDLAAPGTSIVSTVPGGGYATYSGTSMATPHVTGAAALVWSADPSLTYREVEARLLGSVDPLPALAGKVATGGRLNVAKALQGSTTDTIGPRITAGQLDSTTSASRVRLTFSEPINPATFTAADVTNFTGPAGPIAVSAVQVVSGSGDRQFDVFFAPQTTPGNYQFSVGPAIADVAGNLMDQNGDGVNGTAADVVSLTFTIAALNQNTFTNATAVAIRDFSTTYSTISVGQDLSISDVNVRVDLNHTYDGDLYLYLVGPGGIRVDLSRYHGGSGDNYTGTVFDDEASVSIRNGRAPFSGSFRPEQALSAFDGLDARGNWTLYVYDGARGDVGTLKSWSLVVTANATAARAKSAALTVRQAADAVWSSPSATNAILQQRSAAEILDEFLAIQQHEQRRDGRFGPVAWYR